MTVYGGLEFHDAEAYGVVTVGEFAGGGSAEA